MHECFDEESNASGDSKKSFSKFAQCVARCIQANVDHMLERRPRARLWINSWHLTLCVSAVLAYRVAHGQELTHGADTGGAAIFSQRCSVCHGDSGQGVASAVTIAGPSLKAEHDLGHVMTAIESGPNHMPAFSRILTADQIHGVAQYVTTNLAIIPLLPGDIGEGGKLFRTYCAACHRTAVRGGVLAFAGRNAPALTNKSAALIAGAIRWGPGTMPSFPAPILSDQQLASTVAYVRFVQHPPNPGGNPLKQVGPVAEGGVAALVLLFIIVIAGWIERGGNG